MDKVKIKEALKQKMESLSLSGNKVAPLIGISSANVSNILNKKFDIVGEAIWRKVMVYCDFGMEWQVAKTANLAKVYTLCRDAQENSIALMISERQGSGKTFSLKYYKAHNANVCFVSCTPYDSTKNILNKIAAGFGIGLSGTIPEMIEMLVEQILRIKKPLIEFDEYGDLKEPQFGIFKTLYNQLEGHCGFIISGGKNLAIRMSKGVAKFKQAYCETYSRGGGEFIPLNAISAKDVSVICEVNGITTQDTIRKIYEASKGDLRQVERMIHKIKKQLNLAA